jgi:tRNA U34 2-thiouridine synthase MnmA/TrmU
VLLSGGLDSLLAARVMQLQGIDLVGIHLYTGLCITEHKRRTGQRDARGRVPQNPAFAAADTLGIPLEVLDISDTYMDVITKPRHGRGAGVNPCKDCRIHMLERTRDAMQEFGAEFIVTGEVVGQRPMSQVHGAIRFIHARSGVDDLILSPLSAKLLPETRPEREGWVDRSRLYGFHGRSRKPQLALARELGLTEFEQPAGGCCFLTDEAYARKFRDLFAHDPDRRLAMDDVILLGVGRHFRTSPQAKLIVGRYEEENAVIERHAGRHPLLRPLDVQGPSAVMFGPTSPDEERRMAAIVARYSQGRDADEVAIECVDRAGSRVLHVAPADPAALEPFRI